MLWGGVRVFPRLKFFDHLFKLPNQRNHRRCHPIGLPPLPNTHSRTTPDKAPSGALKFPMC